MKSWISLPLGIGKANSGVQSGQVRSAGRVPTYAAVSCIKHGSLSGGPLHPGLLIPQPSLQLLSNSSNGERTNKEGSHRSDCSDRGETARPTWVCAPGPPRVRPKDLASTGPPVALPQNAAPLHPSAHAQHKAWVVSLLKMQASTDVTMCGAQRYPYSTENRKIEKKFHRKQPPSQIHRKGASKPTTHSAAYHLPCSSCSFTNKTPARVCSVSETTTRPRDPHPAAAPALGTSRPRVYPADPSPTAGATHSLAAGPAATWLSLDASPAKCGSDR